MNVQRLANLIFNSGEKITEAAYQRITEDINTDRFTLSEMVCKYKQADSVLGKVAYLLEDGSRVLVSSELIESLNRLDMDKTKLEEYMVKSGTNFKKVLGIL